MDVTTQTQRIDIYYWTTPNGRKATIMAEELDIPYNVHFIDITKGKQFEPDFLAIAPNNRIPAIVDPEGPDGAPIQIFESGAILLYLARKFRRFYPEEERQRAKVDVWLMWQMGGFGPMLGQAHHFNLMDEAIPYAIKRYNDETQRLYRVLNAQLTKQKFVAGEEYTIADIAIFPWVARFERHRTNLDDYLAVKSWFDRVKVRPAVIRGMAIAPN
ncbi:glutathione binding-like protein [Allomesorhizobium camelthorni]|uniref:Glutathione S-transferase family protein n=1 Tax=Allomesorhizobium camelthorni TaxID=475069 RepID=A0A6G4WH48_9HYPH|nr:glutathione binding-like protein [Mesorhizobium camelthorni]NGO53450.1 glutathione S-transferase family protein [Mesorhizobium camelthorni]